MREYALITGSSTTIVQAFCREWIQKDRTFIFLGRSESKIKEFSAELTSKGCQVIFLSCDLSCEDDLKRIQEWLDNKKLTLSYFIHGASIGMKKPFHDSMIETLTHAHKVNSSSLIYLLKIILSSMNKNGRVLVLSSTAAFYPGPGNAIYFADKAFQNSLVQALAYEYKPHSIKFLILCAGPLIEKTYWSLELKESGFVRRLRLTSLEKVAGQIESKFDGNPVWIPGIFNQIFHYLSMILPKNVLNNLLLGMNLYQKKK
jgi:short-subunit dehydrogenase